MHFTAARDADNAPSLPRGIDLSSYSSREANIVARATSRPAVSKRAILAACAAAFALLLGMAFPVAAQTGPPKFIPTFLLYSGPALVASDAAKLAKFDLIELPRSYYGDIDMHTWSAIKAFNPNAQIYLYEMAAETPGYLDSAAQLNLNGLGRHNVSRGHSQGTLNGNNPALFQLDASGNRIYDLARSNAAANQYWYLMDFGSTVYQAYWLEAVKADIVNQPWVADGVFADNCPTFAGAGSYSAAPAWYSTNAAWSAAMNAFVGAITTGLHAAGQKLWCSKGYTGTTEGRNAWISLDVSANPPDALLEQGAFAVQWGNATTQFYDETTWKQQVDILGAIKKSKVAMLSHTKLLEGQSGVDNLSKPVTYWQTLWYSLGSFLLGKNDELNNSYFMFSGGSGYNKIRWYDEYDKIDLGKALGPYSAPTATSPHVYWREFEKGYVYVNPSAVDVASVTLSRAARQLTHDTLLSARDAIASVNSIALKSHEAAILLKADVTAAPASITQAAPAGVTTQAIVDSTVASTPSTFAAAAVSATGLVAAYGFNEGAGTTVADVSGNNNTGTIGGATWTTAGRFGNALAFNGTSAQVTVPNATSLRLTTGMTLEAWVYPTATTGWRAVIDKNVDGYYLMASTDQGSRPAFGGYSSAGLSNYESSK